MISMSIKLEGYIACSYLIMVLWMQVLAVKGLIFIWCRDLFSCVFKVLLFLVDDSLLFWWYQQRISSTISKTLSLWPRQLSENYQFDLNLLMFIVGIVQGRLVHCFGWIFSCDIRRNLILSLSRFSRQHLLSEDISLFYLSLCIFLGFLFSLLQS